MASKVIIRCDTSLSIGTGHFFRCLNLLKLLEGYNINFKFVTRDLPGNIILSSNDISQIVMDTKKRISFDSSSYESWLEVSQEEELASFREVIREEKPDWVIVDHYGINESWEKAVKGLGPRVFVIDDIFRKHCCDVFLDQNFHKNHLALVKDLFTGTPPQMLLGPRYALLAPQFLEKTPVDLELGRRVMVFFGGSDPDSVTSKYLPHLLSERSYHWVVVAGKFNPSLSHLIELNNTFENMELHIQTTEMAALMSSCCFLIGSGGTITWEKCFLGLPSICISIAENQFSFAEELDQLGAHKYLGFFREVSPEKLLSTFRKTLSSRPLLSKMREVALNLKVSSLVHEVKKVFL